MTIGKKGFQPKGNPSPKCPKRANGRSLTPSLKYLGRQWKANKGDIQAKYRSSGNMTAWNKYIKAMRKKLVIRC